MGVGGWGTVFRATAADGSALAVKVIDSHPDPDDRDRERFQRITQRLMALGRHPSLVEVLDAGYSRVQSGHHLLWIAMPYVEMSVTLQHRLNALGSPPSTAWTRKVIASLAAGLHVLHANQIVHRDLTPENVLILPGDRVLIIDFDVACLSDTDRATPLGRPFGTPLYRAPEQLDGECCHGSDLWALGVIAYEMYAGRHPFARQGMPEESLKRAIRDDTPEPPSRWRPGLSPREDELVLRLLEKIAWRRGRVIARGEAENGLGAHSSWPRTSTPQVLVNAETRVDVEAVVSAALAGHAPDSVVVPANRAAPLQAAREQLGGYDIPISVEPAVAPFAFPDWEARKTLAELPYRPDPGELYDERLLDDPERLRDVARSAVAEAARNGADRLLAPWTVASEAVDLQMLVSLRMLGDTLNARDETPATASMPVIATVALPVSAITEASARVRIANALAGYPFDAVRLALQGLGWSSPPRQITAAIDLALLLQDSGVPVYVLVSNSLRELFWVAGVAGAEGIPGGRRQQALPGPASRDGEPRKPAPRFELGSLRASLSTGDAIAVLESGMVPESDCDCAGCGGLPAALRVRRPAAHNVMAEVATARMLKALTAPERECWLREQLQRAEHLGRELVVGGAIDDLPPVAARLRAALDEVSGAGLLRPQISQRLRQAG